jgi:hypothetical protein
MVVGPWIVNLKEQRCKNWINGLEVSFSMHNNVPYGKIQSLPKDFFKETPFAIDQVIYVYKMWRNATYIFKKVYLKKNQHPQRSPLGYVGFSGEKKSHFPAGRAEPTPACRLFPGPDEFPLRSKTSSPD